MDILMGSFLDQLCLLIKIEPQMTWGKIRRRFTHRVEEMVNKGFVFFILIIDQIRFKIRI